MIKLTPSPRWNREWHVTGIPTAHKDDLPELNICVLYAQDGKAPPLHRAVALDNHVIPAIVRAVNNHESLLAALIDLNGYLNAVANQLPVGELSAVLEKVKNSAEAIAQAEKGAA